MVDPFRALLVVLLYSCNEVAPPEPLPHEQVVVAPAAPPTPPKPVHPRPCVVDAALHEVGVREVTVNGGPEVDRYLASVGLGTGLYWCSAFVHERFRSCGVVMEPHREFASALRWSLVNPVFHKGDLDKYLSDQRISQDGDVFTLNHDGGQGHCRIITDEDDTDIYTVEGNTNSGGSRNGDGCYKRIRDKETLWTVNRVD